MKKLFALFFLAACISFLHVQAQDLYIRFNMVPEGSNLLTGSQSSEIGTGKPITFDEDNVPVDAYLMDAPAADGDIYSKIMTLPAGNYEYQVVKADGTGTQGEKTAWTMGRPFTVTEETAIVFRAKIIDGFVKYLCDAQTLHFSSFSDGTNNQMFHRISDEYSQISITDPNYKGNLQAIIYPDNLPAFVADVLPIGKGKYNIPGGANGKVRWQISYNRHTLSCENAVKLVTLLDNDLIGVGADATLGNATDLQTELGTFSNSSPVFLIGGTTSVSARIGVDGSAGSEKANDLLKLKPEDVNAYMCYTISQNDAPVTVERVSLITESDMATLEYETDWTTENSVNVSEGLDNGTYTLNIHYETVCHNDTIKSDVYSTTFTVANTTSPTGLEENSVAPQITVNNQNIQANLSGNATVSLFSITGKLIDHQDNIRFYDKNVNPGLYILSVAGEAYKVIVK